jgi:hypothetical protein
MTDLKGWHPAADHGITDPAFTGYELRHVPWSAGESGWAMRCPTCSKPHQRWQRPPTVKRRWQAKHQWELRDHATAHTQGSHSAEPR